MDWSNESFVKLYTRDTTTWKLFSWQARCLLTMALRKADRSGVIEVGDTGLEGLAAMVELPLEIVELGAADLIKRTTMKQTKTAFVLANFIEAQDARQSDAQRKREFRLRRREDSLAATPGHTESHVVQGGHTESHEVTPGDSRVEESRREREQSASPPPSPAKVKRPRAPGKKPHITIPDDWQPHANHRKYAAENSIDLDHEAGKFRDDALKKDQRWADWDYAFWTWLKRDWVKHTGSGKKSTGTIRTKPHPEEELPFTGGPT